jgi:hypothetical protein
MQSERESESDRDGTDERDASGHNSKKRKIKNVSPKTDRFKVRSLREFGYSKRVVKHDEDDNSEEITSLRRLIENPRVAEKIRITETLAIYL